MEYQIITNNPNVKGSNEKVFFIEGSFEDVLVKVRDLIHAGYQLISHPLGASLRMMFSPYRSIIVGNKTVSLNDQYVEVIENSIENYKKHMSVRNPDIENSKDYALIDNELLKSALEECKRIYQ